MTGYNHYPWCTCGWCVGGSSGNVLPSKPTKPIQTTYTEQEKHQATQALKSYGATSYSRCFVNPNASCPVCGQSVYFYSNDYGSRVFFDELGKPWAKHPCTDNGRVTPSAAGARPTSRPLTEIKDILDAEKKIDQRLLPVGKKARSESWQLAVVIEVKFADFGMEVKVEDLSSHNRQNYRFFIYCDQQLIREGDFVSRRGETFSFLHSISLEDIEVVNGDRLVNFDELEGDIDQSIIPNDISQMVPSEKRHFSSIKGTSSDAKDNLRFVLAEFAKRRIVGAKLVSHYLNETGRTTDDGSPWTPRLAFFLILLSGVSQEKPVRHNAYNKGEKANKNNRLKTINRNKQKKSNLPKHIPSKSFSAISPKLSNDIDEWARMLSRLGRVSRKADDG